MSGIKKMLSFNHIGNLGRLANQMFQYASLKGIARNRGYSFIIPPREVFGQIDNNVKNSDVILYDVFDIESKNDIALNEAPLLKERFHHFDEEIFINCPDNVDLYGYFQTEKYFKNIENEIREDFSFKEEIYSACKNFINENFNSEVISLHIRRGDYTSNPNHPIQSLNYYQNALSKLPNVSVIVFSDDEQWCKEQELFKSDRFLISEGNSTDADLCLMHLCNYHIIANSSFSWWGAWLAKSKHTIAPRNWFGGECVNKTIEDYTFDNFEFL
jgi:hypothetical protein